MSWTNSKNNALTERAQAVIPMGMYGHQSMLLLPDDYPQFFGRAEGAYLWDVDGNRYSSIEEEGYGYTYADRLTPKRLRTLWVIVSTNGSRAPRPWAHSVAPVLNTSPLPRLKLARMAWPRSDFAWASGLLTLNRPRSLGAYLRYRY